MILQDKIYGQVEVTEPVLLELLNLQCLQRLKEVSSGGYYPASIAGKNFNRYDHSIGVLLLLRKFGARIEEQIAGLIHDISHSAFSHTIDYIFGGQSGQKDQSYQDSIHEKFVKKTQIPEILNDYGFELSNILNDKNWSLKETELPDICTDRIDYFLRTILSISPGSYGRVSEKVLAALDTSTGKFAFCDKENALYFAEFFNKTDAQIWSGKSSAIMFFYSGLMFKYALQHGYLARDDFYQESENAIIAKLIDTEDSQLQDYISLLNTPPEFFTFRSNSTDSAKQIHCKVRRIDPYFLQDGKLIQLSEADSGFRKMLANTPKYITYGVETLAQSTQ